jgi:molecular chaperone GrpE
MLTVRDHLARALDHIPEAALADEKLKVFIDGIESTLRELDAVFTRNGVTRIEALGQPLDPHRHQAMVELATNDARPGTIVEEMQTGYMLKDRLLRPALVAVAKAG